MHTYAPVVQTYPRGLGDGCASIVTASALHLESLDDFTHRPGHRHSLTTPRPRNPQPHLSPILMMLESTEPCGMLRAGTRIFLSSTDTTPTLLTSVVPTPCLLPGPSACAQPMTPPKHASTRAMDGLAKVLLQLATGHCEPSIDRAACLCRRQEVQMAVCR